MQSTKTRPEADCGSDHELLITKFRLKLKKVGETTSPFRYDLNQIPYDYIVEVMIQDIQSGRQHACNSPSTSPDILCKLNKQGDNIEP